MINLNILTLLPLLRGWVYSPKDVDKPFTVPKGQEKQIAKEDRPGWFITAMISLSDPYAELVFRYLDPYKGIIETNMRPYALKEAGLTVPSPMGIWCSRYDDSAKVYVVNYSPALWFPIPSQSEILVRSSPLADLTVYNYSHVLVVIRDIQLFRESLSEILKS